MNRLQYEKSPYLLQHANNPVGWYSWGPEALEAARREDKPIFLSIGYSTCHWCHVMAHESFEDQTVAGALNRDYIPIKVDREERPDVDGVYMSACVAMNGSGGWPLNLLLTPDQKPFWAGTYLPKGQLLSLLDQAATLWKTDREKAVRAGEELTAHLRQEETSRPGTPTRQLVEVSAERFRRSYDREWGGFSMAPKFPTPHILLFLLRYAQVTGDTPSLVMAEETLEHMYRGGIFDHIGGGFSRYSTDRKWLAPHFEKMLYDNALLALAYTEAYQQTGRAWCADVTRRTLDYVLGELADPRGGFTCGQDADSEGVEGKYYLFTPEEINQVLGFGAHDFCRRYGVTPEGNFHGQSILNLIDSSDWEHAPEGTGEQLRTLYDYRRDRTKLHRDDKVLTAWNGLMIAALARAGLALEEPRYLEAAQGAVDFIRRELTDDHGRLYARWREGEAAHPGKLEDYAFYAWGLLELYGTTFRLELVEEATRLTSLLLELFFDPEKGGFYPYPSDGEQLITRAKETYDGAMPSGNSVAALVLSRLERLTGEERWRQAAKLQFRYLSGAMGPHPAGHSFALLALLEELWPTAELVVAARETPAELISFLRQQPRPGLTVLVKTSAAAERLAKLAPFTANYPIPEVGTKYYLCHGGVCETPRDSLEGLKP